MKSVRLSEVTHAQLSHYRIEYRLKSLDAAVLLLLTHELAGDEEDGPATSIDDAEIARAG